MRQERDRGGEFKQALGTHRVVELDGSLEPIGALISPLHPCNLPGRVHNREDPAGKEAEVVSAGLPPVLCNSCREAGLGSSSLTQSSSY